MKFILLILMFIASVSFNIDLMASNKAKKKHRNKARTTMQMRANQTNLKLEALKAEQDKPEVLKWEQAKVIARVAIDQRKVDPDKIKWGDCPVFIKAVQENDLGFAKFLLQKGANAKYKVAMWPALRFAKTVKMARLLAQNGAREHIKMYDSHLLTTVMIDQTYEPRLITFYVANGANPNKECNETERPPLLLITSDKEEHSVSHEKMGLFVRAGAYLTKKSKTDDIYKHHTVPQTIKKAIENLDRAIVDRKARLPKNNDDDPEIVEDYKNLFVKRRFLQKVRSTIKHEHNTLAAKQNTQLLAPRMRMLHAGIPAIVASYAGPIRDYDELESLPVSKRPYYEEKIKREHLPTT